MLFKLKEMFINSNTHLAYVLRNKELHACDMAVKNKYNTEGPKV